jgi:hypothetical protein
MPENGETKPTTDIDELVILLDRKTMMHSLAGNAFDRLIKQEPGSFNLILGMVRQVLHDLETQYRIRAGIEAQQAMNQARQAAAENEMLRKKLGM